MLDEKTSPALARERINALCESSDGTLWVDTDTGGLVAVKDGHAKIYNTSSGLTDNEVFSILEDHLPLARPQEGVDNVNTSRITLANTIEWGRRIVKRAGWGGVR